MASLQTVGSWRNRLTNCSTSRRRHLRRVSRRSEVCIAQKMYVPSDRYGLEQVLTYKAGAIEAKCSQACHTCSFGGKSPERKAADALCNLFTFVAAR